MLLNRLDRIQGTTSLDVIKSMPLEYFDIQSSTDANNSDRTYYQTYRLKKIISEKIIGLNDFSIKPDRNIISFDITAKFKPKLYTELINRFSIEEYINHLNSFGFITLDVDNFIKYSKISLVHSTKDVKLENDANEYLNLLKHACSLNSKKIEALEYNHNLVISKRCISNPQRLTCYSKFDELSRNKLYNKQLVGLTSSKILDDFKNVLRFELEISRKRNICKLFNIQDNKLVSILNSNTVPVVDVYNKLIGELGEAI